MLASFIFVSAESLFLSRHCVYDTDFVCSCLKMATAGIYWFSFINAFHLSLYLSFLNCSLKCFLQSYIHHKYFFMKLYFLYGSEFIFIKGNTKFWYGVMNLVEMNILEAYTCMRFCNIQWSLSQLKSSLNWWNCK